MTCPGIRNQKRNMIRLQAALIKRDQRIERIIRSCKNRDAFFLENLRYTSKLLECGVY
jgi:hypothetical protein